MKVINKVLDREVDGVHFVDIRNYLGRRLCWYVKVICGVKDPCKRCDFNLRPVCFEVTCDCENRNSCYKCVHEGDILISCVDQSRVYVVVKEDQYLRARLATQKDLDGDHQLHRIGPGVYIYRGHWIRDLGYYEPDKRVVWESEEVNNTSLGASAHGFSLGMCLQELKWSLEKKDSPYAKFRRSVV